MFQMTNLPAMLTPREVAAVLQVSYESALAFIKFSGIGYIRIGRQYRVSEKVLTEFLNQKGITAVELCDR